MTKNILFVNDDVLDTISLEYNLVHYGFKFQSAKTIASAVKILSTESISVIVSNYIIEDGLGITFIGMYPDIPVIIITDMSNSEYAVHALKTGAYDFLIKDEENAYIKMIPIACQQSIDRKTEEAFRAQMKLAVDQCPSSIVITDTKGTVEYVNPTFTEVTGYTFEETIGNSPRMLNSGHHDKKFFKDLWDTLISGRNWQGELYNKTKSGNCYWERANIAPLKNQSGKIINFVKISDNFNEYKNSLQEKIDSEKLQSTIEFAGAVSHEMNQPLQIISGYTEILLELSQTIPAIQKPVQHIITNITRIADISEKIKNITEHKTIHYLGKERIFDIHAQPKNVQNDEPKNEEPQQELENTQQNVKLGKGIVVDEVPQNSILEETLLEEKKSEPHKFETTQKRPIIEQKSPTKMITVEAEPNIDPEENIDTPFLTNKPIYTEPTPVTKPIFTPSAEDEKKQHNISEPSEPLFIKDPPNTPVQQQVMSSSSNPPIENQPKQTKKEKPTESVILNDPLKIATPQQEIKQNIIPPVENKPKQPEKSNPTGSVVFNDPPKMTVFHDEPKPLPRANEPEKSGSAVEVSYNRNFQSGKSLTLDDLDNFGNIAEEPITKPDLDTRYQTEKIEDKTIV
ncbi:MAG: PAS domain-containing protein, partial [Candidatus Cloacimonetes bacterium]|nr:PAS domain-containing protein [Candidatus Cloacimonadota bacterium]